MLKAAIATCDLEQVTLLTRYMNKQVKEETIAVFHKCIAEAPTRIVLAMLRAGLDVMFVDQYGRTALHVAAEFGKLEVRIVDRALLPHEIIARAIHRRIHVYTSKCSIT